ncbi:hypothetical protein CBFG_04660 [Clostridiales bacterium 1_7_47FAA]|nr:hypothetical protein CBFG_04660 [Clostridiales bacterium 1_7_47FAA]
MSGYPVPYIRSFTPGSTNVPRIQLVLYNRSQGDLGGDDAL